MSSSGFVFTSQQAGVDLSRLVNSITAFETVTGFKEPHYRLMVIFAMLAGSAAPLSNSEVKQATGWPLSRVGDFLGQLKDAGLTDQWNEGRTVLNKLSVVGLKKARALTELLNAA